MSQIIGGIYGPDFTLHNEFSLSSRVTNLEIEVEKSTGRAFSFIYYKKINKFRVGAVLYIINIDVLHSITSKATYE